MSEYGPAHEERAHHVSSPISVPWVILASLIAAGGLLLLWQGATTLAWYYFVGGSLLVLIGFLMLMNDRAGLDHA